MAVTLQVVGHKKSGKTTVMHTLLAAAAERQLTVATIKHTHEALEAQTDSGSFAAVAPSWLLTPDQTLAYRQDARPLDVRVAAIVATCTADVVLVEGGKALAYPKLVLLRPEETPADWQDLTQVSAFARLEQPEALIPALATTAGKQWLAAWLTQEVTP